MAVSKPAWRAAFDAVDSRVSPAAERAVRTDAFADAVGQLARMQRESLRLAERSMRRWWHAWNLPAGTDVRRLAQQVTTLERQVRDLSAQLQAAQATADAPPAPTGNGSAPTRVRRTATAAPRSRTTRAPRTGNANGTAKANGKASGNGNGNGNVKVIAPANGRVLAEVGPHAGN